MTQNANTTQPEEKKQNKVLNTIVNVILVLAIVLGIFCSFTAFVAKNGNSVPSFFGFRPFAIQSDSMKPTFCKGDLIIDRVVDDPKELKVGDIISFWTVIQGERALNTHRIISISDNGTFLSFVTKGDNNSIEDGLTVHQSEIVGKYLFKIPGVGTFIDFLQTSKGFLLVIVLPCAIFFIYQLIVFFKALFAYQAEKVRVQYQADQAAQQSVPQAGAAPQPQAPAAPAPEAAPAPAAPAAGPVPAAPAAESAPAPAAQPAQEAPASAAQPAQEAPSAGTDTNQTSEG